MRVLTGLVLGVVRLLRSKLQHERDTDRMLGAARRAVVVDVVDARVLVTGSTRGIGRALAEAFVRQGASVVVHGRRESEAVDVARQLARKARPGATVVGLGADLAQQHAGTRLVERAVAALGGVDVVVNNAGVHDPEFKPLWETTSDQMTAVVRVNLLAAFEVCAAAIADMLERGVAGRIVNVSTMAARSDYIGAAGVANYGISKVALEALGQYAAAEAGPHGITVSTVRPTSIDTDMLAPLIPRDKRMRMLPADSLVAPVLHLAGAPHDDVHGRTFDQQELLDLLAAAPPAHA